MPQFPEFKLIEVADRDLLHSFFQAYQPETSELTFTNIFIWREHYQIHWSIFKDWLIIACHSGGEKCFALPPIGPLPRMEVTRNILQWLKEERGIKDPSIERADSRLVNELAGSSEFIITPTREHFDYVYQTENLIKLSGNRYHAKKNHLNKFRKTYRWSYEPMSAEKIKECMQVAELWCRARRCHEDMDLTDEANAVREILENFSALKVQGGMILIEDKVRAFAIGEMLNQDTAVIHIEKADPEIPQLFVAINQQFCENQWSKVPWVNREQDLGDEGLRQAKMSYHPSRLIQKFRIKLPIT